MNIEKQIIFSPSGKQTRIAEMEIWRDNHYSTVIHTILKYYIDKIQLL